VSSIELKQAVVPKDVLENVVRNIEYNKAIINHYELLQKEMPFSNIQRKVERISDCNRVWQLDKYEQQKVKDFKRTNLCKDKFCANCKKVKQASRMAKYIPHIEQYRESLYHMVLTQPNVPGEALEATLKHMARCFKHLVEYLTGHKKVKGLAFDSWGYQGSVRSLEVTFRGDSYHPHYHVGLVMDKLLGPRVHENVYSYDYRSGLPELKRLFSDEEILIQKIWYLLINGKRVTKKAIDELELGYSCMINEFAPGDYAELFKYMTKECDEDNQVLNYDNFKTLYNALYRVKQIQGYGCLYRITDDGDTEAYEAIYEAFIEELKERENPTVSRETPQDLLGDTRYLLISRKSYFKYLRQLYQENNG